MKSWCKLYQLYDEQFPNRDNLPGAIGTMGREVSSILMLARKPTEFFQALSPKNLDDKQIAIKQECRLFYGHYKKIRGKSQERHMFNAMRARDQGFGNSLLGGVATGNDKVDGAVGAISTLVEFVDDPIQAAIGFAIEKLFVAADIDQEFYFYGLSIRKNGGKVFNNQDKHKELTTLQPGASIYFGSFMRKYLQRATGILFSEVVVEEIEKAPVTPQASAQAAAAAFAQEHGGVFKIAYDGKQAGLSREQVRANIADYSYQQDIANQFEAGGELKPKKKRWRILK